MEQSLEDATSHLLNRVREHIADGKWERDDDPKLKALKAIEYNLATALKYVGKLGE